ncbi:phospholipase D-like domain-containing protein [Propionivibrio sp.]|uniref:phospholipase D-like domain-containing protein n=1 Tax=Propionivibrio sp. TaxID=2212460 RepID=UPI0039E43EA7
MEGVIELATDFIGENWELLDLLLVMVGLAVYVGASQTLNQRRHPSAAIAWVLGILLVPYVALPLYLAFGSRKVVASRMPAEPRPVAVSAAAAYPTMLRSLQLGAAMGLPDPVSYDALNIHADGAQALEALRRIIAGAADSLDVSTFLIGRDVLGDEILQLLERRARAGVRVRLLIDGIGIYLGGYLDMKPLTDAGIEVVRFVPPFRSPKRGRTNLRNHRKMVIADGKILWCGGRNLAAEYFEGDPRPFLRRTPWIDLTFDLAGELVAQARGQFERDWAFAIEKEAPPCADAAVRGAPGATPALAQLVDSGPDRPDDTIFTLLVSACFTSRQRILAVTPYFVPESSLLTALTLAARRGIEVDLVMPEKSNHRLADFARHRALRDMVVAGARVWLHPRMVHAKAVLVDDELALAGSANLDGRSLFLNYEMMIAFYDQPAVAAFARWVEARRKECRPYLYRRPGLMREVAEGLLLWLAFQL